MNKVTKNYGKYLTIETKFKNMKFRFQYCWKSKLNFRRQSYLVAKEKYGGNKIPVVKAYTNENVI